MELEKTMKTLNNNQHLRIVTVCTNALGKEQEEQKNDTRDGSTLLVQANRGSDV